MARRWTRRRSRDPLASDSVAAGGALVDGVGPAFDASRQGGGGGSASNEAGNGDTDGDDPVTANPAGGATGCTPADINA